MFDQRERVRMVIYVYLVLLNLVNSFLTYEQLLSKDAEGQSVIIKCVLINYQTGQVQPSDQNSTSPKV